MAAVVAGARCGQDMSRLWRTIYVDRLRATLFSAARLSGAEHVPALSERAARPNERDNAVTDEALEILSVIYALGDSIAKQEWASAGAMQERLLQLVSPGVERPHVDTVASPDEALIQMAERRPSTQRH